MKQSNQKSNRLSFKERLERARVSQDEELAYANDNEELPKSNYFGIEHVRNIPACLDLRFADGMRKAIPYSLISEIDYDPSGEIKITCTEKEVIIKGRDMEVFYDYLTMFRVKYAMLHTGTVEIEDDEEGNDSCVLTSIELNDI